MKKVVPFTPMILGQESKNLPVEILQYNGETMEVPFGWDLTFFGNTTGRQTIENGDMFVMYKSVESHWDDWSRSVYSKYTTLHSIKHPFENAYGKPVTLEGKIFFNETYLENRYPAKKGRKSTHEKSLRESTAFFKMFEVIEVVEVSSEKTPEYYG